MRAVSFATYDRLVGAIYEAGVDARRWTDFLSLLSRAFGGTKIGFHCHDYVANLNLGTLQSGYDPVYMDLYAREFAPISPWAKAQARMPVGRAQTSEMLVARNALRKTSFYADWVRPQEDIGTGVGITIDRSAGRFVRLSCNIRFRDEEKYQAALLDCINALAPHLERAFRIGRQLRSHALKGKLAASFEDLPTAIFLLGARGQVHYANRAAERLRRDDDVLAQDRVGRLMFRDPNANRALARALFCITNRDHAGFEGEFTARNLADDAAMRATVAPLGPRRDLEGDVFDHIEHGGPVAVATIHTPSRHEGPSPSDLARLYGLTGAEAALALQLFAGHSLQAHAKARGISIHTARKQLSAVFEKTGCSQQSQLVALLARTH